MSLLKLEKVSTNFFLVLLLGICTFISSYYLLIHYTAGDQTHYIRFYNVAGETGFGQLLEIGRAYLGAAEPLSLAVLWLGSNLGIDKVIFISLLNSALVVGVSTVSLQYKVKTLHLIMLLTGFYFLVLYTGAERLKIAYVFFVWALVLRGNARWVLLFCSVLCHFQIMLLLVGLSAYHYAGNFEKVRLQRNVKVKYLLLCFFMLMAMFAILFSASSVLVQKYNAYVSGGHGLAEFINIILLVVVVYLVAEKKKISVFSLAVYFPVIYLIGGDRVNMIAYTLAVFIFISQRKLATPPVIALQCYFIYKSVGFVSNVLLYGHGFA